ncbi:MAG: molybdenum cofactor biosynthesis protein [Methanosarcinales archaeon]|nr:molybdenum cofactor biosynthesis protein [Methanosarcinales archaeon]
MNPSDEHRKHARHGYVIEVATISSSRYGKHGSARHPADTDDTSGAIIIDALQRDDHTIRYTLLPDDLDMIRHWFAKAMDSNADAIITTGGTGLTPGDVTIEAIRPLISKEIPGFGEIFRAESIAEIGYAAMLTRAIAGVVRGRAVFCMPGSSNAVKLGIKIIAAELGHVIEHARGRV